MTWIVVCSLAVVVLLPVAAAVRWLERRSLFFPIGMIVTTPADRGLAFDDVAFPSEDGTRLTGWWIPAASPARATLLFFHGNGGNISHRIDKTRFLRMLGLHVLLVDYRGYGHSQGRPSEDGLYRDARASLDYLAKERGIPESSVVVYGESLGGAVAARLASERAVKGLVIECSFSSMRDMARKYYPWVPGWVVLNRFDALSAVRSAVCPKLFIASVDDEIVPYALGEKLFAAAREPKRFVQLRGSHNTAFLDSFQLWSAGLQAFLSGFPEAGRKD